MPMTVLIVDDHPTFRSTARAVLEAEGFEVVGEAPDGATAVAEVERLHPEVVLLDIQLPDADGIDLVPLLRRADGSGPAKIVLISSRDRSDYGAALDASGAAGFIPKAELCGPALAALLA